MARTRRRYRRYRKSGRWSSNIQEVANIVNAPPGVFSSAETIMTNPAQNVAGVSQAFTVKNLEITFTTDYQDSNAGVIQLESLAVYIMYVPQGMNVTSDYNLQHPEYIMAYKFIGSPSDEHDDGVGQQYQPIKVRTRLARKLQSGDGVILFIKGINSNNNTTYNFRLSGLIRWWTKAN